MGKGGNGGGAVAKRGRRDSGIYFLALEDLG
jgi:hypothetical protein